VRIFGAGEAIRTPDPNLGKVFALTFLLVHGKPAVEAISKFGVVAKVIEADYHFSRQTSKATARGYGLRAAQEASLP
jgi:hypothetical protein